MVKRISYAKKRGNGFGAKLKMWRNAVSLTQADAAKRLGIKGRCPGAYLSQIESDLKPIPYTVLLKVHKVYGIPSERVLMEAYSPQLPLPILVSLLEKDILWDDVEGYLKQFKHKLDKDEKKELIDFANFLILRRASRK